MDIKVTRDSFGNIIIDYTQKVKLIMTTKTSYYNKSKLTITLSIGYMNAKVDSPIPTF